MPDVVTLTGPQGTALNVGSYLEGDPDFGDQNLLKAAFHQAPAVEGGLLAFEALGVRPMMFPLRVPSSVGLSPQQIQGMMRLLARPGATLDIQLDGEPAANAVRFDVLAGRVETKHEVALWRGVRHERMDLRLDVMPLGYLPTMILLASTASMGLPGALALNGAASVVGDAPGLAELVVRPAVGTSYLGATWIPDLLAWSLGARASFQGFWPAASLVGQFGGPSLVGDAFALGSQGLQWSNYPAAGGVWQIGARLTIPSALEPAYRGRHRAFAYLQSTPSQYLPFYFSLDAAPDLNPGVALASWQPIATLIGATGAFSAQASPAYVIVDLGELTLPPVGSGVQQAVQLRLWANQASTNPGVATANLRVAGISLLPLDGPAGFLPRGLAQPTLLSAATLGQLELDSVNNLALIETATGGMASSPPPLADARLYHLGAMPLLGASTTELDLLIGMRTTGQSGSAISPIAYTAPAYAGASVRYRPRFTFTRGL